MAERKLKKVTFEDARLIFKNFSGKETQYNRAGDRNFAVVVDEATAKAMEEDGWNIKWPKPREDPEDTPLPFLKVKINFSGPRPPRVVLVTSKNKTTLAEEDVATVDYADIKHVDLIVSPYEYDFNGNVGVTAYLDSVYVTINEDELQLKYSDVPDNSALGAITEGAHSGIRFIDDGEDSPF